MPLTAETSFGTYRYPTYKVCACGMVKLGGCLMYSRELTSQFGTLEWTLRRRNRPNQVRLGRGDSHMPEKLP